jgi:hypothetical protein
MGWGTKLPLSVDDLLDTLDGAICFHVFDELGVEFLNMLLHLRDWR